VFGVQNRFSLRAVTIHRDLEMASDETGERIQNEIYSTFSQLKPTEHSYVGDFCMFSNYLTSNSN
jgi:uncharacterized protein (UPF0210 family)